MDLLKGYRVLDVSTHGVVPLAGSILADWGADVIKVEDPVHGDIMRAGTVWGVPAPEGGSGHLYHMFNRGKRAAAINLKHEQGREAVLRLAERSDVFLTSYPLRGAPTARHRRRRHPGAEARHHLRAQHRARDRRTVRRARRFRRDVVLVVERGSRTRRRRRTRRCRRRCRLRHSATARPGSRSRPVSWRRCCTGSGRGRRSWSTPRCSTPGCGRCRRRSWRQP